MRTVDFTRYGTFESYKIGDRIIPRLYLNNKPVQIRAGDIISYIRDCSGETGWLAIELERPGEGYMISAESEKDCRTIRINIETIGILAGLEKTKKAVMFSLPRIFNGVVYLMAFSVGLAVEVVEISSVYGGAEIVKLRFVNAE